MAYVVPESVLTHQVCTSCKNYLSFPPIKVYRNGEIKCGRCSVANDGGTISIFHTLARSMLFPCVNRFEGCSELLHYTDVKEHEKNCAILEKECSMCPDFKGSLLNLVQHYKMIHPRDVLVTPEMTFDLDKEFCRIVLYCDYQRNVILVLKVSWDIPDLESISVSYSATVETDQRKLKLGLLLTTDDDDPKQCNDLKYFLLDPFNSATFKIPDYLMKIKCKWSFVQNELMTTIPGLSRSNEEYKRRRPYNFYVNKEFKEKYKILNSVAFKISACGKQLVFENNSLHIACDFCENMFAFSGYVRDVYSDGSCYVCGTCFIRGVTKSLENNGNSLEKVKDFNHDLLHFYCRFDCGKFFRSGNLLSHEDQCIFNAQRNISDDRFVQLQFGDACAEGAFSKENVIFDLSRFKENGKFFIATRDNFKCVIDYDVDDKLGVCNFHVNHRYDTKTHYISVHKWEDQTYNEVSNDFSMKIINANGPSLFALILKEVQEDSKFVFNI